MMKKLKNDTDRDFYMITRSPEQYEEIDDVNGLESRQYSITIEILDSGEYEVLL